MRLDISGAEIEEMTYTYHRNIAAWLNDEIVTVPDQVDDDQRHYDANQIEFICKGEGGDIAVRLDGAAYGLNTYGTGDMVVQLAKPQRRSRRIWTDGGVVCLRTEDCLGDTVIRQFWVPANGGYVREVDDQHPGTLGQQVCVGLADRGPTLAAESATLIDVIRSEYRRSIAAEKREQFVYNGY